MRIFNAGSIFFMIFLFSLTLVNSGMVYAGEQKKYRVFLTQDEADDFMKLQGSQGNKTNLTIRRKEQQRYSIVLKGYKQWTSAFRSAQKLEKQDFADVEVVKGRFEHGYSVLVTQVLSKKKAGVIFNSLRRMGLNNTKVHVDSVSIDRYVVSVRPIFVPDASVPRKEMAKKPTHLPQLEKEVSQDVAPVIEMDKDVENEEIILVMSDSSELSYEISMEDESMEWGGTFVLEEDLFTRSSSDATDSEYAHLDAHAYWHGGSNFDFRIAARLDGFSQHGKNSTRYSDLDLDYGNSFVRYREEDLRITFGAQTIRWGKMDFQSPTDNMVTNDLSRGVLNKWDDNFRSSFALRTEFFAQSGKLDFVYLPDFRPAELPDKNDVWHPINLRDGQILGFEKNDVTKSLIQNARIDDDVNGDGGFGFRFSTVSDSVDWAVSLQRTRLSTPYYRLNDNIRQALLINPVANVSNVAYTFKEEHPRNWVFGADLTVEWQTVTWRMEAAWFSDLPATTKMLEYKTYDGIKWAASAEFYPGDGDTRINLQLSGKNMDKKEKVVDLDNTVNLSGEVETLFSNERWRLSGRFNIGLSYNDIYLSPEVSFLGWEPYEIYTAFHYLDGEEQSIGGFYKDNDVFTIGIKGSF